MSCFSVSRSTTLPLASSPHCNPITDVAGTESLVEKRTSEKERGTPDRGSRYHPAAVVAKRNRTSGHTDVRSGGVQIVQFTRRFKSRLGCFLRDNAGVLVRTTCPATAKLRMPPKRHRRVLIQREGRRQRSVDLITIPFVVPASAGIGGRFRPKNRLKAELQT